VSVDADPSIEIVSSGECSYNVNLAIPGIETEEINVLKGVRVTADVPHPQHSTRLVGDGLYYYPRLGSIRFIEQSSGDRTDWIQINGEKTFVENPNFSKYDDFEYANYGPTIPVVNAVNEPIVKIAGLDF
jgi:hypothetical protein